MKITNIRSEDLVERIINNGLSEDDKNRLIEIFKPKKYKHNPSPETVKELNKKAPVQDDALDTEEIVL